MADRVVSDEDKKLSAYWQKRIDDAIGSQAVQEAHKRFKTNRNLIKGVRPDGGKLRANLFFSNLAAMRPQVYAKDPEFKVTPKPGVESERAQALTRFGRTAELVLHEKLVQGCDLKKRVKRQMTSAFTNAIGWLKAGWQEDKRTDQLVANQIKDAQDNLMALEAKRKQIEDPNAGRDVDTEIAKYREMLAGLQASTAEVTVAKGPVLDFVRCEDVIVLDTSIDEITDYLRADALAFRVWMTIDHFEARFGFKPAKAKQYASRDAAANTGGQSRDQGSQLVQVFEIWHQSANRVYHLAEGEEGFCDEPVTPDWTGKRWYPFFLLLWNEVDGFFLPPSDVELIEPLVMEYNEARDDLVKDRRDSRPWTAFRKGGSITDDELNKIRNRQGNDLLGITGSPGKPISDDLQPMQLGAIDPANYNTGPARADIEQLIGGGDAARGSVMQAKTATEAEILSQGLRSRSAERTDVMEDMLSELGGYVLEMCLRKMDVQDVRKCAGADAVWPELTADQVLESIYVSVRGGSTGRPDRLQEQDRWTQLLPQIKETLVQVAELRAKGENELADAAIELLRETLRRFDERIDLDSLLPKKKEPGEPGMEQDGAQEGAPQGEDPQQPAVTPEMIQQAQQIVQGLRDQVAQLEQKLADKEADRQLELQKAGIAAHRDVQIAMVRAPIDAAGKVMAAQASAQGAAAPVSPQAVNAILGGMGAVQGAMNTLATGAEMPEGPEPDGEGEMEAPEGMQPAGMMFGATQPEPEEGPAHEMREGMPDPD